MVTFYVCLLFLYQNNLQIHSVTAELNSSQTDLGQVLCVSLVLSFVEILRCSLCCTVWECQVFYLDVVASFFFLVLSRVSYSLAAGATA